MMQRDVRIMWWTEKTPHTRALAISSHQKGFDWEAVAADNIQFAMLRIGYRIHRGWYSHLR